LELLRINFEKNLAIINSFFSALETIPMLPNESIEDYFARMLKFIKDSKGM
jgi:predicted nucleotidyltransferase component of viral defense system